MARKRKLPAKRQPNKAIAGFEVMVKFFVWEDEGLEDLMERVEETITEIDDVHTVHDFDVIPIYEEEIDGSA